MSKAKELFDETTISNIHKAMILFKDETDIIKKELDYAEKCHNLEEQLGCPLEVVEKALTNGIYINGQEGLCIVYRYRKMLTVNQLLGVWIKDYKKTWWLREDKSE